MGCMSVCAPVVPRVVNNLGTAFHGFRGHLHKGCASVAFVALSVPVAFGRRRGADGLAAVVVGPVR